MQLVESKPGSIDLLISDVVMPGANGWDFSRLLLEHYPDIKCLFMSGYTADVIAQHGVLEDGVHFIQKPFTQKELIAGVQSALGLSVQEQG